MIYLIKFLFLLEVPSCYFVGGQYTCFQQSPPQKVGDAAQAP